MATLNITSLANPEKLFTAGTSALTHNAGYTTNYFQLERHTYEQILPANLFLSLGILVQNSLVIYDYAPQRKKLITALFILIAVADVVLALGEILRAGLAIACISDDNTALPRWLVLTFPAFGQLGWTCSVYFNLVLTLLRVATLSRPFDVVNKTAVVIAIISGPAFWFLVVLSDNVYYFLTIVPSLHFHSCDSLWVQDASSTIATRLMMYLVACIFLKNGHIDITLASLINNAPILPAYVIPCLITLVCIPIQAYYLKKSLSASANSQVSRDSDYITVTIILVSSLYVVCYGTQAILYCVGLFKGEVVVFNVTVYTLPLLNAVGFPLIMILRKPTLRDRFKGYILAPIRLLNRACSALTARYQGYQEIEE